MRVHGGFSMGAIACGVLLAGLCLAGSARAEGVCPNEALRVEQGSSWLPDCRAYEMVSPAYQEGYPLFGASYAADGSKAVLEGIGNIGSPPGAGEAALEGNFYLEERGSGGWGISSLNAPLSEFVGQLPVAQEASAGISLWNQHTLAQSAKTRGLYIRSSDGVYSYVGPLDPHDTSGEEPSETMERNETEYSKPSTGTSNYEHIVLKSHESPNYWSFDDTKGLYSLYEYSGTDNLQPELVGVTGPKGSTKLVGECGNVLGGGEGGSEYNALSSDGETIFFTVEWHGRFGCEASAPATAEVYARLHGSRISSLPAETVDVSLSECTSLCGAESGKSFEGASENGQHVFFTSTQKLTNDAVDGTASGGNAFSEAGCAAAVGDGGCNLYEYEFEPEHKHALRLIAGGDEVLGVTAIAENGDRVYFVARKAIVGAGENEYHKSPEPEQPNLYVYDASTGSTTFIATLGERGSSDETDWTRLFEFRTAEVNGENGQFLLFASTKENPLKSGVTTDTEGSNTQLFEYDAVTKELVRVTKGENGYAHDGNGVAEGFFANDLANSAKRAEGFRASGNPLNISDDGKTVVFETAGELSPRGVSAAAGCTSIYEFRSEGPISQGSVHLISDGRDVQPNKGSACGAVFEYMDASGNNILFSTADPLIVGDVDGVQRSLYDARVGGGFGPTVGEGTCGGVGCEASASTAPALSAPASSSLTGSGNFAPPPSLQPRASTKAKRPVKCSKGKQLSHGKCVKAGKKKRAKAKKSNRRDK